jgi:D-alanyl-D-alanine carboxypeptidase
MPITLRRMAVAMLCSLAAGFACAAAPTANLATGASKVSIADARSALASLSISATAKAAIQKKIDASPQAFASALDKVLAEREADPMLLYRVDKGKALPKGFAPADLANLEGTKLSQSKQGLRLRAAALRALEAMDAAARRDGVTLLVSSSYRSYQYQVGVWDRTLASDGLAETEASVAKPGHSQHQLGTAIDFGSITDAFAETKASRWLALHSREYGFSLSFPKGMSAVTGYKWESWHYRYIGAAAAALEADYFEGVQQYLMLFLDAL